MKKKNPWAFQWMQKRHNKIQQLFIIKKKARKLGIEGHFNMINGIFAKLTSNVTLNSEILKVSPLPPTSSSTREGCCLLFNIVLRALARGVQQETEIKASKR